MYQAFDILFDDPTHNPNPDGVPLSVHQQGDRDYQAEHQAERSTRANRLAEALEIVLHGECRVLVTPAVAIRYAHIHGAANRFSPSEYEQLIRQIDTIIGRISYANRIETDGTVWPNPNNGTPAYSLHIGTEGSEVLYVRSERTEFLTKAPWLAHIPFTAEQVAQIDAAAQRAGADEHSVNEERTEFRIWWD